MINIDQHISTAIEQSPIVETQKVSRASARVGASTFQLRMDRWSPSLAHGWHLGQDSNFIEQIEREAMLLKDCLEGNLQRIYNLYQFV